MLECRAPIRILVVDDHAELRRGIRLLLESQPRFQVIAEAADGAAAVRLAAELAPDVVVMDIQMAGMDGIKATALITDGGRGPKVIGVSASDQEAAYAMLTAGASRFVVKGRAFQDLGPVIEGLFALPEGMPSPSAE
jgi:DNA-binding NarL/FixJ family response regulator